MSTRVCSERDSNTNGLGANICIDDALTDKIHQNIASTPLISFAPFSHVCKVLAFLVGSP